MAVDASSLSGEWFVAPMGAPHKGAYVRVSERCAGSTEASTATFDAPTNVRIGFGHKPMLSATATEFRWRHDEARASVTLTGPSHGDPRPRHGWLRPEDPDAPEGPWIGGDLDGGPLLQATQLAAVPEDLLGRWRVTPTTNARPAHGQRWELKRQGRTCELTIERRHETFRCRVLALRAPHTTLVSIDPDGGIIRLRAWSIGEATWLVGELDSGRAFVLSRESAQSPWPVQTLPAAPTSAPPETRRDAPDVDDPDFDAPELASDDDA